MIGKQNSTCGCLSCTDCLRVACACVSRKVASTYCAFPVSQFRNGLIIANCKKLK